jgi:class I lanthipeptide synthase
MLFEPADFVLVRAPLLPVDVSEATPADVEPALAVASLPFLDALASADGGEPHPELDRTFRRYLVRMSTRPTPFGLFAGVGVGEWGERTELALAAEPRPHRTRPDMGWLLGVVDELESKPAIRRRLRVFANRSAFVRAGRVVLSERVSRGEAAPPTVSVRASAVVRRVLAAARTPVEYGTLASLVLAETPGATEEKVETLLDELLEQTLLLTDLRPPLTVADPAQYVLERLDGIDAAVGIRRALEDVVRAAARWEGAAGYRAVVEQAAALGPYERSSLQVDSLLPLAGRTVSRLVADEAARAAELLLRLSPAPIGPPYLAAYRRMFESRYGLHRTVPLLELLDPDVGLGPPPFDLVSGDALTARRQAGRVLTELAATALRDRARVVELDAPTLERLHPVELSVANAPPSLDLNVVVAAGSRAALDAGEFTLAIAPGVGSMAAGRTLGRFADALPEAAGALRRLAAAEEAAEPGKLWAELTYAPRSHRLANVAIRPNVRRYELAVGVTSGLEPARTIPADELLVGVRGGRFSVRWQGADEELAISAGHMLNHARAPALARFLSSVGRDGTCLLGEFQWGPAAQFPFLPRVQSGRIVLALARWRLSAAALPEHAVRDPVAFRAEAERWRERWDVPRYVVLVAGDRRLQLDLTSPDDAEELRRSLRRGGAAVVSELFPGADQAWLTNGAGRRFASELVVPLVRRPRAPAVPPLAPTPAAPSAPDVRPPGSDWLFAKLYCGRDVEDDLLAGPVRELVAAVGADFPESFFIRYGDPGRHLRLRFRGDPTLLLTELLPRVCAWAQGLIEDGTCLRFALDTYEREVERFGGPRGMVAAERLFSADSQAVLEVLASMRAGLVSLPSLPVAVLTVEALLGGLGLDARAQAAWCRQHAPDRQESGGSYRTWKDVLRPLLREPAADGPLAGVLAELRAAAAVFAETFAELSERGQVTRSPGELAGSIVHLHLNRLIGADAALERLVIGLLGRVRYGLGVSGG